MVYNHFEVFLKLGILRPVGNSDVTCYIFFSRFWLLTISCSFVFPGYQHCQNMQLHFDCSWCDKAYHSQASDRERAGGIWNQVYTWLIYVCLTLTAQVTVKVEAFKSLEGTEASVLLFSIVATGTSSVTIRRSQCPSILQLWMLL